MYGNNDYRDYLQHARSHKYILKIGKGANARYFYTQEEINAFRKKAGKAVKGVADAYKEGANRYVDAKRNEWAKRYDNQQASRSDLSTNEKAQRYLAGEGRRLKRIITRSGRKQVESQKMRNAEKANQLSNQKRAREARRVTISERQMEKKMQLANKRANRKQTVKDIKQASRRAEREQFFNDVEKKVKKAKKAAKRKWDMSLPAREYRKAKYRQENRDKAEQATKKAKEIQKKTKRKIRRKKIKRVINSVLRKG